MNNPQPGTAYRITTTPQPRVSQRPGFVPLRTGDPIPDALRAALDVETFIRELQQAAQKFAQSAESELEP